MLALVAALCVVLLVVAVLVAALRDVLAATVTFAAFSLAGALLWVTLQAPDVALTEAAIGAGIATSLFLVAIAKTDRAVPATAFVRDVSPASLVGAGAVGASLLATVPSLPPMGAADAPAFGGAAAYYLAHAKPDFGVQNVVTAVLVSYRGFDTFGELAVIFAAGLAVLAITRAEVDR